MMNPIDKSKLEASSMSMTTAMEIIPRINELIKEVNALKKQLANLDKPSKAATKAVSSATVAAPKVKRQTRAAKVKA